MQEKIHSIRKIVEKYIEKYLKNKKNIVLEDSLQLLNNPCYLFQDLAYPCLEGMAEIANNWGKIMEEDLF